MDINERVSFVRMLLSYAYGAVLVIIGLDKVFQTHIIVQWTKYVSPLAHTVIPIDPNMFVTILGVAEIVVGILFFTRWVRLAAYIAIAVLALIIVNLFDLGMYDIAARDALIALGAYALAVLAAAQGYSLAGRANE